MNKQIEIIIPERKVLVAHGSKLLPGTKVAISGDFEKELLIRPIICIDFSDSEQDPLYLNFSTIGPGAIPCKLDFVEHVFPAFEEPTSISSNECLPRILITEALSQNIRLVMFDIKWTTLRRKINLFGICHINFRQKGVTSKCDVSGLDPEEAVQLGHFFENIPRL